MGQLRKWLAVPLHRAEQLTRPDYTLVTLASVRRVRAKIGVLGFRAQLPDLAAELTTCTGAAIAACEQVDPHAL